jgi:tetratricopeptide (TPR) repeat protein
MVPKKQEIADSRLEYATVLVEIGELNDAEAQIAELLEGEPENLTALDLLAKIKHMRGEISDAIACWAQVHAQSPGGATAIMRLHSMLQLAKDSEHGGGEFLVLGPFQLWRKPAAHIEFEEVFHLFLARRPDLALSLCDQLAEKYSGKDLDVYKLAVLAKAWIAELSGQFDLARSILEELGNQRGFETDIDRVLTLARLYDQLGTSELLEKAVHIYLYLGRSFEKSSIVGHLAALYRKLGKKEEADRYEHRFLQLFRKRMHRPSFSDVTSNAAHQYIPLYRLVKVRFTDSDVPREESEREKAIGLALRGDRAAARQIVQSSAEVLDQKYCADLAVLDGALDEATRLYIERLEMGPTDIKVIQWLLQQHGNPHFALAAEYFRRPEVAQRTLDTLEDALRRAPARASLWKHLAVLHEILGLSTESARCSERAAVLEEAALRKSRPVGRALAVAVYHFVGKPKGVVHEIWAARKPAEPGRGGFLEEILGNLTPEMTQAVRNTFLSVREYAQAKWPQKTKDIRDYSYTYKVTKEDEPSGGLSAGLPSALAFLSVFINRPVPQNIASSGALIADSHDVLVVRAVGEPEYKVRGAYNRNLDNVILPEGNRRDLQESPLVPARICEEMVRYVSNIDGAVVLTFGDDVWIN